MIYFLISDEKISQNRQSSEIRQKFRDKLKISNCRFYEGFRIDLGGAYFVNYGYLFFPFKGLNRFSIGATFFGYIFSPLHF